MNDRNVEYVSCNLCGNDNTRFLRELNSWTLVQCRHCSLVYVNPRPTLDVILAEYQVDEATSDSTWAKRFRAKYESEFESHKYKFGEFVRKIERHVKPPGRVLDIGCNTGAFLSAAQERGWEPYGVDIGSWAVEFARARGLDVFHGTLEEAHFPDAYFDAVFCSAVLEHLPDPKHSLLEIHRVLKKDGILFVIVPNINAFTIRLGLDLFVGNTPPAHLYYFTPRAAQGLLEAAGFECVRVLSWGVPNDFFQGIFGHTTTGRKLDSIADNLFTKYSGGRGFMRRAIYYIIRSVINSGLNIIKMGAIIEVHARKRA